MNQNQTTRLFRGRLSLLALAALATGLLAMPAVARDHDKGDHKGDHRGGRGGHGIGRFLPPTGYLDLNASQEASVERMRDATRASAKPLMEAQRELRQELRAAIEGANPDATAIGNLTLKIHANRQQLKSIFDKAQMDFVALLDPAQKEKYENFRELRDERRDKRRDRMDKARKGGNHDDDDGRR